MRVHRGRTPIHTKSIIAVLAAVVLFMVSLSGIAPLPPSAADVDNAPAGIVPIEPCVILDTTIGTGNFDGPITPGAGNGMTVGTSTGTGGSGQGGESCDIPFGTDYSAVMLLVEAIEVTTPGNLRGFPTGETASGGVVNYGLVGFENSNVVIVPVNDLTKQLTIEANVGAVDARLTVIGYLEPGAGFEYTPVTPCAFADSRANQGPAGGFVGPYTGSEEKTVRVTGLFGNLQGGGNSTCEVPPTTDMALVNLVAINATGDGIAGIRAAGSTDDTGYVHFEAFTPPMNNSAAVWVPLSSTGDLDLYTIADPEVTVELRAVVLGYADDFDFVGESQYVPLTPCAGFDSRVNQGATGGLAGLYNGGERRTFDLVGTFPAGQGGGNTTCGVPPGAVAVHLNLVAINAVAPGNLRAFATGTEPAGGVVNFVASGTNNSNGIVVPISADGLLSVEVNAGAGITAPTTEVRGVVLGYFFDPDQELQVEVTSPPNDQITVISSPVTIEGFALDDVGIESVGLLIRDMVTGAVSFPAGDVFIFGPEDLDYRHPATLTNPGGVGTTFTFGPIDLDLEGSGLYRIEPLVTSTDGSIKLGEFSWYRTITSPAPTGSVKAPAEGAEVSQPFSVVGTAEAPAGVAYGFVRIRTTDTGQYLATTPLFGEYTLASPQSLTQVPIVISGDRWSLPEVSGPFDGRTLEIDQLVLVNSNGVSSTIPLSHQFVVGTDDTDPVGEILDPVDGDVVVPPLELSGSARDGAGIVAADVEIFDSDTGQWWNGSSWQGTQVWLDVDLDEPGFAETEWSWADDPADGVLSGAKVEISLQLRDRSDNLAVMPPVVVTVL